MSVSSAVIEKWHCIICSYSSHSSKKPFLAVAHPSVVLASSSHPGHSQIYMYTTVTEYRTLTMISTMNGTVSPKSQKYHFLALVLPSVSSCYPQIYTTMIE